MCGEKVSEELKRQNSEVNMNNFASWCEDDEEVKIRDLR